VRREARTAFAFIAPALLLLSLFVVWPISRAIYYSFTSADVLLPGEAHTRGLANYGELIRDPRFRRSFYNTALFSLLVVPLQTVLAFFAALLVDRRQKHWRWLRAVFFTSQLVSLPVLAVSWSVLYNAIGLAPKDWLLSPDRSLIALALMSVWQGVGFQMLIFLAGLQHVSPDLLDAARVDGAGPVRRLILVILPQMKRSIAVNVVVTTILAFRLFVQPYLLTRGGPDDRTLSIIQWIYETTFLAHELGRASAGIVLFLLLVALLVWAQRSLVEERTE
jgi:ABC-type sugar transport system permease subunit